MRRVSERMKVVMCAYIHFFIQSFTQQGYGGATMFPKHCAWLTVNRTDTAPTHNLTAPGGPQDTAGKCHDGDCGMLWEPRGGAVTQRISREWAVYISGEGVDAGLGSVSRIQAVYQQVGVCFGGDVDWELVGCDTCMCMWQCVCLERCEVYHYQNYQSKPALYYMYNFPASLRVPLCRGSWSGTKPNRGFSNLEGLWENFKCC